MSLCPQGHSHDFIDARGAKGCTICRRAATQRARARRRDGVPASHGRPLAARLWEKVAVGTTDECWPWGSAAVTDDRGYGLIGLGGTSGRNVLAHRAAYELTFGPVPNDLLVCHKCDNPPCCNPSHMFVGTHADNNRDARTKGRVIRGADGRLYPAGVLAEGA